MIDSYNAIVYDLDGTLVDLAVDWQAAADPIAKIIRDHGGEPGAGDALDLLEDADALGIMAEIEPVLCEIECAGAENSDGRGLLSELETHELPVGICSLNCEAACETALATHGVGDDVDVIVGRDSVPHRKPHPEPLRTVVDRLGVAPETACFVGDSESDAITARRANTAFRRVGDP
ncbi:HAD family hydrolase [Halocatena halophila]|uniref:HAD family hydrolase n=1 Tax=Halocatena halophila TaxID=2814576 RepID=UPI002ED0A061